jgi:hypothetical protein
MWKLPDVLKEKLKEPLGHLVDEQGLLDLLKDKSLIVAVGDRVTYTLLRHRIAPRLCIVDYILERRHYPEEMRRTIEAYKAERIHVVNPPGFITDALWDAIRSSYKEIEAGKGPFCIEVDGEEDLASLAAIYLAPRGVTVIYGLPNKGVVVVSATKAHKEKVREVLDRMS